MVWKRQQNAYGKTPIATTPYQKAAQVWDERIGSARVQAKNWRLATLISLGVSGVLAGGMLWQATQSLVTCLLYTSPSPRDRQKSRMPSSA